MLFPWVGLFEQMRLADVFVHYDDVQFTRGGFFNRVQVKTERGPKWLTVPLRDFHLGQHIKEVQLDDRQDWRAAHVALLNSAYEDAPHVGEMLDVVREAYAASVRHLAELSQRSIDAVCRYFGFDQGRCFVTSSSLNLPGRATERVLRIVQHFEGKRYVTGHGARHYFDHELLERAGIRTEYLDYRLTPYRQLHGAFTPYVSILDLIANVGREGVSIICSPSVDWRSFLARLPQQRVSA